MHLQSTNILSQQFFSRYLSTHTLNRKTASIAKQLLGKRPSLRSRKRPRKSATEKSQPQQTPRSKLQDASRTNFSVQHDSRGESKKTSSSSILATKAFGKTFEAFSWFHASRIRQGTTMLPSEFWTMSYNGQQTSSTKQDMLVGPSDMSAL